MVLISIDGFRPDYFEMHQPPTLNKLAAEGVRAKWTFPTTTFPNHYSVATGLLPAHHGIVENNVRMVTVEGLPKHSRFSDARNHLRQGAASSSEIDSSGHEQTAAATATATAAGSTVRILGPAPASLSRLKNEYRIQIILKSQSRRALREALDLALHDAEARGADTRSIYVEIDPVNLM